MLKVQVPFIQGAETSGEFVFCGGFEFEKCGGECGNVIVATNGDRLLSGSFDCYSQDIHCVWRLVVVGGRNIEAYFRWVNTSFGSLARFCKK